MIIESCVETLEKSIVVEKNGASRIELCANLNAGGTTPSESLIRETSAAINIPIRAMIRPRGGDFVYSDQEIALMKEQIDLCKKLKVEAVVFGILTPSNEIDVVKTRELAEYSKPLKVVFHKAIDATTDLIESFKTLMSIKEIDTVLTSGGAAKAVDGVPILKQFLAFNSHIEVLVAGGVTAENLTALHKELNANAYHGRLIC